MYASPKYHSAPRYDFVELHDGSVVRLVGFLEFHISGTRYPLVLAEKALEEDNARLQFRVPCDF